MTGRVDEVQAAVDTCVLDVTVTHGSELLAEVCAVLVLDVLDYGVPAVIRCQDIVSLGMEVDTCGLDAYHPSLLIWSP